MVGMMNEKKKEVDIVAAILPDTEVAKEILGNAYTEGALEHALQDIVNGVNDIVQTYKRIDLLLLRQEEFPKNTSKKIKRFELPALLQDAYQAKISE